MSFDFECRNEFIKAGEVTEQSEIFDEFDVTMSVIESMLVRTQDEFLY